MANTLKEHWETVCKNKQPYEVSWTEEISTIPISLINRLQVATYSPYIGCWGW
jgi:hypothetical protein